MDNSELKLSEEQLRRAIEEAPIPTIMQTEDGQVLLLSRSWTELTGYNLSDMPTFDKWVTSAVYDGAASVRNHMQELFKGNKNSINVEFTIRTHNRGIRNWSFSASSPGTLLDGRRFIIGMAVDITKHKNEVQEVDRLASFPKLNPNPIIEVSIDGIITYANPAAKATFTDLESKGADHPVFSLWEDVKKALEDKPSHVSSREINIYGQWYQQEFFLVPNNQSIRIFSINITERKKVEEALRESESKYRLIVDTAQEGIWVATPDGKATFVNQKMANMLGYPKEDILGKEGLEFLDKPQAIEVARNRKILSERGKVQVECKFIKKDGSALWTIANTAAVFDNQGNHIANIAMHTDITKRKKTEETLRKSEEQAQRRAEELQTLMDIVPVGIWISNDPECKNIVGNNTANHLYEAIEGENVSAGPASGGGLDTTRRFFRDGKELLPQELPMQEAARKNIEIKDSEIEVVTPSGKKSIILGNAKPLLNGEGKVRGCLGAFIDITERKKGEQALQTINEELTNGFRTEQ